jgi:glycosyltransferase involved in cell wall biosynthesis
VPHNKLAFAMSTSSGGLSPKVDPPPPDTTGNVSVFIMTLNEEATIQRCLNAVHWSDDVVILDSYSHDRTVELARNYQNVRIVQRPFDNYGDQRNYGIHHIAYKNSWLLVVDADEIVEPGLAVEVLALSRDRQHATADVYLVRRKIFLDGIWVRRSISNDFWIERVIRPQAVRYSGLVHEKVCFNGGYGRLRGALEHHPFSKGTGDWVARRKKYARLEAQQILTHGRPGNIRDLCKSSTLARRAALKALFYRLPVRWMFYWLYNFAFKFPYLDGTVGLRYLFLETYSQYLSTCILREARNARAHQTRTASNI